jgi:iron(III) transport system permease protein
LNKRNWREPWLWAVTVFSLLLAVPVLLIFASLFVPQYELWQHLFETVLSDYVYHSLLIAFSVGALTLVLGTSLAWLVARYEFSGRRTLQWIILLPMAMPAYILAYTYTGMLGVAGPLQSQLRETFGWTYHDYWFPDVRSVGGAIIMLSLVLYPYVYMLARTAFSEQSASFYEVSRSMGVSGFAYFRKVAFPLARPAILTGTALAMMEAFADYGTVKYFGVNTFTTGIFRTWNGLGNAIGAAQLAAVLTSFVLVLLLIEKHSRRRLRYFHQGQKQHSAKRLSLSPIKRLWAVTLCLLPVAFGFVIPIVQLSIWAFGRASSQVDAQFITLIWNSFYLAASAACIAVGLALLFAYAKRLRNHWLLSFQVQLASLGYAIPGTVIAIGTMLMLSAADDGLNQLTETLFDTSVGLVFSGTLVALLLAYSVRFLAVALHNVEAGLQRIKPSMDDAARSMGLSSFAVLKKVHIPLLRASVLSAILLVFVDVLKELPATLMLRPFNFNTLAVRTFELASEERLQDAAVPAMAIVLVGLLPVVLLTRALEINKNEKN